MSVSSKDSNPLVRALGSLKSLFGGETVYRPRNAAELLVEILADIDIMLDFSRQNGLVLPEGLRNKIDKIFQSSAGKANPPADVASVLEAHGELSELIRPATVATIRQGSFWRNPVLRWLLIFGTAALLLMMLTSIYPDWILHSVDGARVAFGVTGGTVGTPLEHRVLVVLTVLAAVLGSAFFGLYSALPYLRDSTFNPRYNQVYAVRFALGVLAGFILSQLELPLESENQKLGQVTLAFVGGFSAEAVALILQRISDTLVAAIQGSDKRRTKAEIDAAKSSALQKSATDATEIFEELAAGKITPADAHKRIQDALKRSLA